jgi:putative FmdB family regulatory protein
MPLYEYYCEPCNGIIEGFRPMREASEPVPCPECNRDAPRIMSSFNAFTFREGFARRLPDKGTYWHMGKEVKRRAKRMRWYDHPETTPPKPPLAPSRGEKETDKDRQARRANDLRYRGRWGVDERGFRTPKTVGKKRAPKRVV